MLSLVRDVKRQTLASFSNLAQVFSGSRPGHNKNNLNPKIMQVWPGLHEEADASKGSFASHKPHQASQQATCMCKAEWVPDGFEQCKFAPKAPRLAACFSTQVCASVMLNSKKAEASGFNEVSSCLTDIHVNRPLRRAGTTKKTTRWTRAEPDILFTVTLISPCTKHGVRLKSKCSAHLMANVHGDHCRVLRSRCPAQTEWIHIGLDKCILAT